jgi:hypothetical protein
VSEANELLVLRLVLLGIVFAFVLIAAAMLRAGLRARNPAPEAARPVATRARFVLVSPARTGVDAGAVFSLAGEMSIGRDLENGIVLADVSVSGRHALLSRGGRRWLLSDLGSTNGTLVNGRAVDGRPVPLRNGDKVTFGAVVVRFEV